MYKRLVHCESAIMRRHEGGAGCGTRERGQCETPATTPGDQPEQSLPGYYGPAGPAVVNAISGAMPRGALLGRWIASRMMRPGPMRVVRPVRPGPLWRNPGHALLGAPPLAFGGRKKSGRRANPRAQAKQQGPMTLAYEHVGEN